MYTLQKVMFRHSFQQHASKSFKKENEEKLQVRKSNVDMLISLV